MAAAERDRIALALATRQHGCISRRQLREIGYADGAVSRRIRAGLLVRIAPGVYRFGTGPGRFMHEFAALLRLRQPAWAGYTTAAAAWRLGGYGAPSSDRHRTDIHLCVDAIGAESRPGIRVHKLRLGRGDTAAIEGLPTVSPTLIPFQLAAAGEPAWAIERAMADALDRSLTSRSKLKRTLGRWSGRPGAPLVRSLLEAEHGVQLTRSEAEARMLGLIRRAELPQPESNVRLMGGRFEADLLWRTERAVVEIDSYRYHDRDKAFQADRARDAALGGAGWRVMRVTWRMIVSEPEALLVRLTRFLYPG